jgi:transcriptional regulator with XRE-family HTH domain
MVAVDGSGSCAYKENVYKLMAYGVLADRLRAWRTAAGLDQNAVAGHTGVKQQTVSGWERGVNRPSLRNLGRLAEIYGLPLDEVLQAYMSDLEGAPAQRQMAADTVAEIKTQAPTPDEVREIVQGLQALLKELEEEDGAPRRPSDTEAEPNEP